MELAESEQMAREQMQEKFVAYGFTDAEIGFCKEYPPNPDDEWVDFPEMEPNSGTQVLICLEGILPFIGRLSVRTDGAVFAEFTDPYTLCTSSIIPPLGKKILWRNIPKVPK